MSASHQSEAETEGIWVRAAAQLLPGESDPAAGRYLYVYRIRISNRGSQRAQLVSRHWIIVDADGHRHDVKGAGVVGECPDLAPGESFEYMSSCPLTTEWGTMEGAYLMERDGGDRFTAKIGRFYLVPTAPPLPAQL